jgi:hypothetical protein
MRVYSIRAVDKGAVIDIATVYTARQAIVQFLDALERHERAWVNDGPGRDMSIDELARLALEEVDDC